MENNTQNKDKDKNNQKENKQTKTMFTNVIMLKS